MTVAVTVSATTSDAVYPGPTEVDSLVALTNFGANNVWVSHRPGTVAAALDGADCEVIVPGQTVYVDWRKDGYRLIAATGTTKVNIANSQGRTRK